MRDIVIRDAEESDAGTILEFVRELAEYEREPDAVVATVEDIRESLFGDRANAYGLLCSVDGEQVGFAVYFYNYSTWLGRPGLYLEDVYIRPSHRGAGAGRAILRHLAALAVRQGCGRMEWSVLDWNTPAIRFYESLGAEAQNEWIGYRLSGKELQALAES